MATGNAAATFDGSGTSYRTDTPIPASCASREADGEERNVAYSPVQNGQATTSVFYQASKGQSHSRNVKCLGVWESGKKCKRFACQSGSKSRMFCRTHQTQAPRNVSPIIDLPLETLENIIQRLSPLEKVAFSLTCKVAAESVEYVSKRLAKDSPTLTHLQKSMLQPNVVDVRNMTSPVPRSVEKTFGIVQSPDHPPYFYTTIKNEGLGLLTAPDGTCVTPLTSDLCPLRWPPNQEVNIAKMLWKKDFGCLVLIDSLGVAAHPSKDEYWQHNTKRKNLLLRDVEKYPWLFEARKRECMACGVVVETRGGKRSGKSKKKTEQSEGKEMKLMCETCKPHMSVCLHWCVQCHGLAEPLAVARAYWATQSRPLEEAGNE